MARVYGNAASLGDEKVSPEPRIGIVSDLGAAFSKLVFDLVSCVRTYSARLTLASGLSSHSLKHRSSTPSGNGTHRHGLCSGED